MYKELVITIIVLIAVIVGNIVTQNNTKKAVEALSNNLNNLRSEIIQASVDKEKSYSKMNDVEKTWEDEYEKMAYYIEHNELEKVETELAKLKADIETEEYKMAVENLDNCAFILEHIKDKTQLKIVNIF